MREYWLGIPGSAVADLTGNAAYPLSPSGREFLTIFEGPVGWGTDYGTRIRGYVKPPTTGNYTFWIAGDDNCELWLSTDTTPTKARLIARVPGWTASRQWEDVAGGNAQYQKSALIPLTGGQKYYIEALHKEGSGGDNIAVGWQLPSGVFERPIPGTRLEAYQISNNPPTIQTQPADVTVYEGQEARFTVIATGMEPMTYQWQRDGFDLPIERGPALILVSPRLEDSGAKFRCVITNPLGTQTTREATLTVNAEITAPTLRSIAPANGSTVRSLRQVEMTFSEPVQGLDAADLLVNGAAATNVTGAAAGPYIFTFPAVVSGAVTFSFTANHNIRDLSQNENLFAGSSWSCVVDPNAPVPKVRIAEINASNETGLLDENGEAVDWIELENFGTTAVNLNGWSLTDTKSDVAEWIFPNVTINAGARLVVFASGKDRRPTTVNGKLHTNFLLSGGGEFLGLYDGSSPRELISGFEYPEQRVNHSYGIDASGQWKYFQTPTPGAANGVSSVVGIMPPPHFSDERGFYNGPFQVHITTDQPGAQIYYTRNGGDPTGSAGILYTNAIQISATTTLRAAVVKTNHLPSAVVTHTYLYNITAARRTLPAISIVTATNNLLGPTGIIGIGGGTYAADGTWQPVRTGDYHNPSKHGIAWERPTSVEYFYSTNNDQFQIDCGIRVQGSDWMRPRLQPSSKFSYRFYFRGDYGAGKLEYPLFHGSVTSFDQLVLRAGHNDDTNPFLKDELMRKLFVDCGQVGSRGIFNTVYVNGVYKGYYNLVERIEEHSVQAWHGSTAEWDVMEQNQIALDGDNQNFLQMVAFIRNNSMTNAANYLEARRRLDLANFVDYLLVNIYGANGDWPHNNWRAARERTPSGIWRFYIWDAEFALGTYGRAPTYDTFANELSGTSEIPTIYKALKNSPEFRLFWADRVNKHFYNGGALVDSNILKNFNSMKAQLTSVIPSFDNYISSTWIPNRRRTVTNHFRLQGLAGAPGAPTFNQFGGRVAEGFQLTMTTTATGPDVSIYYTTDGTDPRAMFTSAVSATAKKYTAPVTLDATTIVKARMLTNAAWSALTEATFEVSQFGAPLRFTEINYHPPDNEDFEFVELKNFSAAALNLSGMLIDGVNFRFPEPTMLGPGQIIVIVADGGRTVFPQRYPGVVVGGYFSGASLNNGGERLTLKDRLGNIIASVDYHDDRGWPVEADGGGYSLELASREIDPNSPAAWRRSKTIYGSPGVYEDRPVANIVLNEIMPMPATLGAWVELHNRGTEAMNLTKYSIGDLGTARRFVFPADVSIPSGGFYVVNNLPIAQAGGTIFLFDANTNRLDEITFGRQLDGFSVARIDGAWTLGQPTSGAANIAAALQPSSSVVINEWFANPVSGGDDWLELHNTGPAPAALQGMTLSISNAIYRIPTLSFIPAGGFVRLFAAEKIGPEQLGFKLPAAGGTIRLYDANGAQVDSVTYTAQVEGVSEGRLPDGTPTFAKFRGSISPGASNYLVNASAPVFINEVMARNSRSVISPMGNTSDWVELYNAGDPILLDGFSLSGDEITPGQWIFPSGITIPTGGYLLVWFDKTHPPSTTAGAALNTAQSLSAEGGGVYLFNPEGQVVDQIEYGIQAPDLTIGRSGAAFTLLAGATPGAANTLPAGLASSISVRINEWSAGTTLEPAWVELYNSNSLPVWIGTMSLTDELNLAGQKKFVLANHSYLGPNQFGRWTAAENNSTEPGEINFNISAMGESLRLYSGSLSIADTVSFGLFPSDGTYARIPDASGPAIPAAASPAAPNYLALARVNVNEVSPGENKVELRNTTGGDIAISGWRLSNDLLDANKVVIAAGAVIPARGYVVVTLPAEARLDADFGGVVALTDPVTGEQSRLEYGPTGDRLSYRPVATFLGQFSEPAAATLGKANSSPLIGPVVISEIMYHSTDDAPAAEYIELYNSSRFAVSAKGWRVNGGVHFNFADDYTFVPNATVLLVNFNPADALARASFEARYRLAPGAAMIGPLRSRLGNDGDEIILERALAANADGYIPHIRMDRVVYADEIPWPTTADGLGAALHRIRAHDFGNEPLNWIGAAPSPLVYSDGDPTDRDADGMADVWEIAHGLDLFSPADAGLDNDGDGLSNLVEHQLGSDPTDPADGFAADVAWSGSAPTLQFNAAVGVTYRIEFRESLTEGGWQTHSTIGPLASPQTVSTPIMADGKSQRFYRIAK